MKLVHLLILLSAAFALPISSPKVHLEKRFNWLPFLTIPALLTSGFSPTLKHSSIALKSPTLSEPIIQPIHTTPRDLKMIIGGSPVATKNYPFYGAAFACLYLLI